MTTARERIRNACAYMRLLNSLQRSGDLDVGVCQTDGRLQLSSGDEELRSLLEAISQEVLGRLEAYRRVHGALAGLREGLQGGRLRIAVGFSEQMGPCDLYLLASLVGKLGLEVEATYVLATPLSYPMAALSSLYAALALETLGRIEFVLSSEDVAVSEALAEYLAEKAGNAVLVYLASGPTPQVLTLCVRLKQRMRNRAVLIPLAPRPATRGA